MSFLTPKHFQDASRILRGVALVAARAAADSKVWKQAGKTDYRKTLQDALEQASKQSAELAESLQEAARRGGNPHDVVARSLQEGRQSAQAVTEQLQGQLQGVLKQGERLFNETVRGTGPVQERLQQVDNWLQKGSETAVSTADATLQSAQEAASEAASAMSSSGIPPHRSLAFVNKGGRAVVEPPLGSSSLSQAATLAAEPTASSHDLSASAAAVPALTETVASSTSASLAHPPEASAQMSMESSTGRAFETLAAIPAAQDSAVQDRKLASAGAQTSISREQEEQMGALRAQGQMMGARKEDSVAKQKAEVRRKLRERRVPSSPIGRAMGFAQLGASLVYGTVSDSVQQYFRGAPADADKKPGNRYLTEANAERLADALCRMRGAALKLGQMLSIQDENVLPPALSAALERVRAGADIMPRKQLEKAMVAELGTDWRSKLADFDFEPLAAASIGQVHRGTLHDGRQVAMKIQYPGVARSIESDVDNLLRLISYANVLPKGLYVESAAKVAKRELALECDYSYEARCQQQFRQLVAADEGFHIHVNVPQVITELCTPRLLTTELVPGAHIDKVALMSQDVRDAVGTLLLQLTLKELFEWRFMQTDPNWGNFLYDAPSGILHLIDFGAAREFPQAFVDDYLRMVRACAERDRTEVILRSTRMGFLTGDESAVMLDAHAEAGYVVGTPFATEGVYDFAQHGALTRRVSDLGAVMLRHRLTAPPEEAYSLHRKLSGAYLACIKLRARVPCRQLFYESYDKHVFGGEPSAQPQQQAA
ncbi:Atypical kinase COQ8A, mitochondrial [Coccomyxa sp. Obi]|nr:Atypical kinase COQ8A, mitochondrial [Coccomyxa sp. Obi]